MVGLWVRVGLCECAIIKRLGTRRDGVSGNIRLIRCKKTCQENINVRDAVLTHFAVIWTKHCIALTTIVLFSFNFG